MKPSSARCEFYQDGLEHNCQPDQHPHHRHAPSYDIAIMARRMGMSVVTTTGLTVDTIQFDTSRGKVVAVRYAEEQYSHGENYYAENDLPFFLVSFEFQEPTEEELAQTIASIQTSVQKVNP